MQINTLMYADDIVLLADSPNLLQQIIDRLEIYCRTWNLSVNLNKSKAMVFRRGFGRYARTEKWTFKGQPIEIVKEYKYLGVLIRSNLNMQYYLNDRLISAKIALNPTWSSCINYKLLNSSVRYTLFTATPRSVMFYAAQVWGVKEYESVDKLLRYYLKRVFRLPFNTPNYMLLLESGLSPLFMETLLTNFDYILRVMMMPDNRIPKQIAIRAISSNTIFLQNGNYNVNLDLNSNNTGEWKSILYDFLQGVDCKNRKEFEMQAIASVHRNYYRQLEYNLRESNYFNDKYDIELISIIFKARGELLKLNYIPNRPDLPILCSLCNLQVREDILHLIVVCPLLKETRRAFLTQLRYNRTH